MRVAIDGYGLTSASAFRGIGTYLRGLLAGLSEIEGPEVCVLATRRDVVPEPLQWQRIRRVAPGRWALAEHDLRLAWELDKVRADVVHSPAQEPPRRCERPWVQTLHGLLPLVPGLDDTERRRWEVLGTRMQGAGAYISVSKQTADQAAHLLGLDRSLIHVVPHGVASCFHPAAPTPGPDKPYLLYVGEYGPEKGFGEAMAAVGVLAELGLPHRLKMAGRIVPWTQEAVERLRADSPHPERVELLGHVHHERELPDLYRGAAALVVSSRFESFCLPALEAMACGTPVVAFDNSALAETLGGCGVLVPDGDAEALAAALAQVIGDSAFAARLRSAGLSRSAELTWERCAQRHVEVYRTVAGLPAA